jgi:hypothetical protein
MAMLTGIDHSPHPYKTPQGTTKALLVHLLNEHLPSDGNTATHVVEPGDADVFLSTKTAKQYAPAMILALYENRKELAGAAELVDLPHTRRAETLFAGLDVAPVRNYHDVDQEPAIKRRRLLPDRFPTNAEHTMEAAVAAPSPPDSPVVGLRQTRRQQARTVAIDSASSDWATRNKQFVADTPRNSKNQAINVALEFAEEEESYKNTIAEMTVDHHNAKRDWKRERQSLVAREQKALAMQNIADASRHRVADMLLEVRKKLYEAHPNADPATQAVLEDVGKYLERSLYMEDERVEREMEEWI